MSFAGRRGERLAFVLPLSSPFHEKANLLQERTATTGAGLLIGCAQDFTGAAVRRWAIRQKMQAGCLSFAGKRGDRLAMLLPTSIPFAKEEHSGRADKQQRKRACSSAALKPPRLHIASKSDERMPDRYLHPSQYSPAARTISRRDRTARTSKARKPPRLRIASQFDKGIPVHR